MPAKQAHFHCSEIMHAKHAGIKITISYIYHLQPDNAY